MILQALTAYYEQLLQQGKLAAPGWDSKFNVSYELRLNDEGQLLSVGDLREPTLKGKKTVLAPRQLPVPAHVTRTAGVSANFLCDNASYLLGADEKGKPERAQQCFEACAALHHRLLDDVDSPAAKAILAYFDSWQPAQAASHPLVAEQWKGINENANLLFSYEAPDGTHYFASEDPAIQAAWQSHYNAADPDASTAQCLITGKEAPVASVHPAIKGVPGAQSSGAALVSFNAPAFCSFGHEQGQNAPISEYAAFAYTTALNTLLKDRSHCRNIGDTTVVFWAENASSGYPAMFSDGLFGLAEDSGLSEADLQDAFKKLAAGKPCVWNEETLLPEQHFYVLGLSPNAARLSVRFFLRDTFGQFAKHIQQHADALQIVRPAYDKRENLSVYALAMETVNRKERSPSPSPQLIGDLLRSVLSGSRYPATLLNGVALRIRAEQEVTRGRAAILKAYYLRNETNNQSLREVLTVTLNKESRYLPYVLGRLFAVLESIQNAANPGINTTIKDRYFNSACATPAMTFPTLINLSQKHLNKLNRGLEVSYDKLLTELMGKIDREFPARLTLTEQGAFQLGYYHQKQDFFADK